MSRRRRRHFGGSSPPTAAPTGLAFATVAAKVSSALAPTLTWTAVPGATDYKIEWDNVGTFASPTVVTGNVPASYTTPSQSKGARLYARDTAHNGAGYGPVSTIVSIVIPDAADLFVDVDGTLITAHTMDIPGVSGWAVAGQAAGPSGSNAKIKTNALQLNNNGQGCVVDAGTNDGVSIVATFTPSASGDRGCLVVHYVDDTHCYEIDANASSSRFNIVKNNAGITTVATSSPVTFTPGTPYTLRAEIIGSTLNGYVNEILVVTATMDAYLTATKYGIFRTGGLATAVWDNFAVFPPPP